MNKRSMRILGFYQVQNQLVRLAPSRLSKEIARHLRPESDADTVEARLADTEEAWHCLQREASVPFGGITDIRPALEKAKRDVTLDGQDCIDIWQNAQRYGEIKAYFSEKESDYPRLSGQASVIGDFSLVIHKIAQVFDQNHQIRDNASVELLRLRTRISELERQTKRYVHNVLQNKEYQKYFQDALVTVRNNRYVIPVKQEYRHAFPGIVHDTSASGATLYIEPMAIVNANNDLQAARIAETREIEKIFRRLTALIAGDYENLYDSTYAVGQLEFIFAKAQLALSMKATRPVISKRRMVKLIQARHPLIDAAKVVPNTIIIGGEYRILLITGSNTGGKTVSMKTLGLLVLMHQAGLFLPVMEGSELPVFRDVFSDIGDEQDISQNLSTFSSHMKQLIYILKHCGPDDLILADELGSGTDPAEGSAIAIAILKDLYTKGSYVMVTTHYNDLKNFAYNTPGIENGHVEFDVNTLKPTYKLRIGSAGSSHAFSISERLGMPKEILDEARELRSRAQDVDMEAILTKLNAQSKRMDEEEQELQAKLARARQTEEELRREKEKVSSKRQDIIDSSRRQAVDMKRNLRLEAEKIIRELKAQSKESLSEKERMIGHRTGPSCHPADFPARSRETSSRPYRSGTAQNGPAGLYQFPRWTRDGRRNPWQEGDCFRAWHDRSRQDTGYQCALSVRTKERTAGRKERAEPFVLPAYPDWSGCDGTQHHRQDRARSDSRNRTVPRSGSGCRVQSGPYHPRKRQRGPAKSRPCIPG